jgi:hypothetical protein
LWVIAVVASLVLLLFLILCVPLDMALHADVHGKPKFRLRFSWLFGLVNKEITSEKEKPEKKKRAVKGERKYRWRDTRVIFKTLRTKGLLRRLKDLIIKGIFSHLKAKDLIADFKIGLGDPADTGLLFAFIGPACVFLGSSHLHQIRVEPSFGDDAVLEGYSQGTTRLHPIQLIPPLLKFIFSLTTIRVAKTLISSKWKRKKQ